MTSSIDGVNILSSGVFVNTMKIRMINRQQCIILEQERILKHDLSSSLNKEMFITSVKITSR